MGKKKEKKVEDIGVSFFFIASLILINCHRKRSIRATLS